MGHTTDQLREGVSPAGKRPTKWTTVVGHYMSATSDRRSENQRRGGRERTSSGYAIRRPKMTVYCTAVPTPEQRGGGALFPDTPALLMKGMPYALTAHPTGRGLPCIRLVWLGRGPNVWGQLAVHTVL